MARLNEPGGIGGGGAGAAACESVEALKRRFLRQNREIAKANSVQSARIRKLEYDLQVQLMNNMELRKEVTQLKAEVDRRDRARQVLDNVGSAKKGLEKKISEMLELLAGLEVDVKQPSRRKSRAEIEEARKSKEERQAEYEELINAGYQMPVIHEESESRSSSSRRSLSVGEFPVLSPNTQDEDADTAFLDADEKESIQSPPLPVMIDTRPRRRRDSFRLTLDDIEPMNQDPEPISPDVQEPPLKVRKSNPNSSVKRKFEEIPDYDIQPSRLSEEFTFVSTSQKNASKSKSSNAILVDTSTPPEPPAQENLIKEVHISPVKAVNAVPPLDPIPVTTATAPRKALGPKGANFSPVKSMNSKLSSEKALKSMQKPEKPAPILKPISTPTRNTDDSGRPRRTRNAASSVNYALPSLRMKLRRENEELVDAVSGEHKGVFMFKAGGSESGTPASSRAARIKLEDSIDAGDTMKTWKTLPETRPILDGSDDGTVTEKERKPSAPVREKADRRSLTEITIEAARERRRKRLSQGLPPPDVSSSLSLPSSSTGSSDADDQTKNGAGGTAAERRRRQTLGIENSEPTKTEPTTMSSKTTNRRRSTAV